MHFSKLKNSYKDIYFKGAGENLTIYKKSGDLFSNYQLQNEVDKLSQEILITIIEKYGSKSNAELKTCTYLTTPMREILKAEKKESVNLYNMPIEIYA